MRIRIISDLHYALNLTYSGEEFENIMSKIERADLTLIAGDMSADLEEARKFLQKYFTYEPVIFVNGNHAVYHRPGEPIQDLIEEYKELCREKWTFLENEWRWIDNNTAVIGCTGWTNFEYGHQTKSQYVKEIEKERVYREAHKEVDSLLGDGKKVPVHYMGILPEDPAQEYDELGMGNKESYRGRRMKDAVRNMNDYNYGKIRREDGSIDILRPLDTYNMHQESLKYIKKAYNEIVNQKSDATIILITHHPFTTKCVAGRYKDDPLTSAFVSDHDRWLKKFPNIKYLVCGHVHQRFFTTLGNKQLICNPMGYLHYYEHIQDIPFDINKFIEV